MTAPPSVTPSSDRLNGWKEIAAFLGKGTRTAQRWERELALPVHRIGHEGGEIVYAFRSEIDAWSRRAEQVRGARGDGAAERSIDVVSAASLDGSNGAAVALRPPEGAEADGTSAPRSRRGVFVGALLVSAALALLAYTTAGSARRWLGSMRPRFAADASPGPATAHSGVTTKAAKVSRVRVVGNLLDALDADGNVLWSHTFDIELDPFWERQPADDSGILGIRPVMVDLDGDGSPELLLIGRPREGAGSLYAFNADGTVRFVVSPDLTATFGDTVYSGPWVPHRLFTTAGPGTGRTVWAVFVHRPLFPSFVLELDPNGNVGSSYWRTATSSSWTGRCVTAAR